MPRLLFRYLLFDLLRIIGLTTGVLVTVAAFGATIKPLASDALLDAGQVGKYLMLAVVPMLQFALPFAAGFGATLCLHRMTADNEIQAMAVSGLSYRRILRPVLALGMALTVLMLALTLWVIPRFWTLIEQALATDITKVFQASIMRGEPFELGDLQIYAGDIVVKQSPEGDSGPDTRMVLVRVAAAELDDHGKVVADVTANQAVVDIYRRDGRTFVKLAMRDAVYFDSASGRLAHVGEWRPPRAFVLPSVFRDYTKAMTRGQLLALRRQPDDYAQVIEAKQDLIETIRHVEVRNAINQQLREDKRVELAATTAQGQAPRSYIVSADRLRGGQFQFGGRQRVEVVQHEGDVPVRKFMTDDAQLMPANLNERDMPAFDLTLKDCEVVDLRTSGATNRRPEVLIPSLVVAGAPDTAYAAWPWSRLTEHARSLERAAGDGQAESLLDRRIAKVHNEVDSLQREITGRLSARHALSVTALLLLLLGSVLAVWLRGSLPLTIYLWAFLPSIADLILISAGEQLLKDGRWIGGPMLWSGNAAMLAMIIGVYLKLSRN